MALTEDIAEIIYFCRQCETKFLLAQDAQSHLEMFGHSKISELPMG
ncbi:MAG: hypothetical protein AB1351_08675 [Thermoproteota archaeon]